MGLSAPFCPLANLLSPDQSGRWLVGAVGIESKVRCLHIGLELAGAVELLLFLRIVHFGVEINLGDFE
jgi:hypothetical protein